MDLSELKCTGKQTEEEHVRFTAFDSNSSCYIIKISQKYIKTRDKLDSIIFTKHKISHFVRYLQAQSAAVVTSHLNTSGETSH